MVKGVDRVIERLEAVIDDGDDARVLKLALLAHELGPARVARVLGRLGVEPEGASAAEHLVASF